MQKDLALFENLIRRFQKTKILVIGDLMVDRFIRGKVSRISPEAPVPVVQVKNETSLPGGAGNVMVNLASLGAEVNCCGMIGEDFSGNELIQHFQTLGVKTEGIFKNPDGSTIVKTRVIAEHQQVVRFDQENDKGIPQTILNEILNLIPALVRETDGVILSDYGKGMITKIILTRAIESAKKFKKPICVDPKIEHFLFYQHVTCMTPNIQEAMGGMRWTSLKPQNGIEKLGKQILKKLKCHSVLITQGEEGMTLFEQGKSTHIPTKAQEVFDVTGAGDTVIAVLTLALACKANLVEAATIANLAAGIVVGKLGTAAVTPGELKQALKRL